MVLTTSLAVAVSAAFFVLLTALTTFGHAPLILVGVYALMSVITFSMYGLDKSAAAKGRRRTAEANFHLVELVGGWPGALVGQRLFRHKTRKQPFQAIFWCAVIANCAALAGLLHVFRPAWS